MTQSIVKYGPMLLRRYAKSRRYSTRHRRVTPYKPLGNIDANRCCGRSSDNRIFARIRMAIVLHLFISTIVGILEDSEYFVYYFLYRELKQGPASLGPQALFLPSQFLDASF